VLLYSQTKTQNPLGMKKRNSLILATTIFVVGAGAVALLRFFPGLFFQKPDIAPLFYWAIGSFTTAATLFVLYLGFSKPSKSNAPSYSHWSKGVVGRQ
jgi:hypothetical protein